MSVHRCVYLVLAVDRLKLQDSSAMLDQHKVSLSDLVKLKNSLEDEAAALSVRADELKVEGERELAEWTHKVALLRSELASCEEQKLDKYKQLSALKEANGQLSPPSHHAICEMMAILSMHR